MDNPDPLHQSETTGGAITPGSNVSENSLDERTS